MTDRHVIDPSMRAYYEARAAEYDDWWDGAKAFAARDRPGWFEETRELTELLAGLEPARVLDVACGTAFLTRHLRGEVTALDQSRAMTEIAAQRMGGRDGVTVVQGEAVPLPFGDGAFDRVVTAHFYGHLVAGERAPFLAEARRVAPELVVVDSALREGVTAEERQDRALDDGSHHPVYKRYFTGPGLAAELGGGEVLHAGRWFVVVRTRIGA